MVLLNINISIYAKEKKISYQLVSRESYKTQRFK